MPWNRTDPEKERMAFVVQYQLGHRSMTELCRAFGISRKTGYERLARVSVEGPDGCKDRSRAPHRHGRAVSEEVRDKVVQLRLAHPYWGPRKIYAHLRELAPQRAWPAASTMGAILVQEGLVRARRRRRATPPYTQPFQGCQGPNDVWCADFKGWFRTGDGVRCDPLTITDAFSRMLLRCTALHHPTAEAVWPIFEDAFREYGLPQAIRTDNWPTICLHWCRRAVPLECLVGEAWHPARAHRAWPSGTERPTRADAPDAEGGDGDAACRQPGGTAAGLRRVPVRIESHQTA